MLQVQPLLSTILTIAEKIYTCCTSYPEPVLLIVLLVFLIARGKMKSALLLLLGVALCFANYFIFTEYTAFSIPLVYAAVFAGVSIVLLLLLLHQLITSGS